MRARRRRPEAGFTLIEIMFVVAVIAILAALAIPAFTQQSNKGKATSEVVAFFAELAAKQEQYRVDKDAYLNVTLPSSPCPASTSTTGQSMAACVVAGTDWGPDIAGVPPTRKLNIALPMQTAYCRYTITAGVGTLSGANNPNGFVFARPVGNWYHLFAECDMDGNGTMATFFTSSVDSTIQKLNEGE